jgi:hypothetical protein
MVSFLYNLIILNLGQHYISVLCPVKPSADGTNKGNVDVDVLRNNIIILWLNIINEI